MTSYAQDTREEKLQFDVKIAPDGQTVVVEFGRPVAWIAMPKDEAVSLAFTILKGCGAQIERNIQLTVPSPFGKQEPKLI